MICIKAFNRYSNRKEAKYMLGYVEGHHILPKSFKQGGEKDKSNLVYLTAREHFICHWLLTKMFTDQCLHKMQYAFKCLSNLQMSGHKREFTSKQFEIIKRCKRIGPFKPKKPTGPQKNRRKPYTAEQLEKRGLARRGIKFKHKQSHKKDLSEEQREQKREQARQNFPNTKGIPRPRKSGYKIINHKRVYPED